jgi:peptidoglycan/LPS O-acetylase OafA/YrhL
MQIVSEFVMMAYVFCSAVNLFIFFPVAGGTLSNDPGECAFFFLIFAVSFLATVWSFTRRSRIAMWLACCVAVATIAYWWFIIFGHKKPIWGDFEWFVLPGVAFAFAAVMKRKSMAIKSPTKLVEGV